MRARTSVGKAAGGKIWETRDVWVDEYLETSVKNVYAVGEAIE